MKVSEWNKLQVGDRLEATGTKNNYLITERIDKYYGDTPAFRLGICGIARIPRFWRKIKNYKGDEEYINRR